jgi:hypothetical protein
MHTEVFDFIENGSEKWLVYAKNSQCLLGTIEWREDKKLYDYVPNSNGKLMKVLHQPDARRELQYFCETHTTERVEQQGNKA